MQLGKGSATVPVALFGVSPNNWCSRFLSPFGAFGKVLPAVGGTPTGAVETTALPISQLSSVCRRTGGRKTAQGFAERITNRDFIAVVCVLCVLCVKIQASSTF